MSDGKRRAIIALLSEYDRALEAVAEKRDGLASARASWSLHKELAGFSRDGETLEYDAAEADRVLASYRQQVESLKREAAAWRAAIVELL